MTWNRPAFASFILFMAISACQSETGVDSSQYEQTFSGPEGKRYSAVTPLQGLDYVKKLCVDGKSPQELGFYLPSDAPRGLKIWHAPDKLVSYVEANGDDCTMIFGTLDDLKTVRQLASRELAVSNLAIQDRSPDPNSLENYFQFNVKK